MSARATSPRVSVLAAVIALHAGALLLLFLETRSRLARASGEATPISAWLLEPREPGADVSPRHSARASRGRRPERPVGASAVPVSAVPSAAATVDWAAEAARSARRQLEADADRNRQAHALAPQPSPMFAARVKRHEFPWDTAHGDRVETIAGIATVVHLSDQCAVAFFLIVPFAGGCALDKLPARGDLFDHLHDPDPAELP
jgi:hypothetical protein